MTDTFQNIYCNKRKIKLNHLKCIASQCLWPPCVLLFLYDLNDGWKKRFLIDVSSYRQIWLGWVLTYLATVPFSGKQDEKEKPQIRLGGKRKEIFLFLSRMYGRRANVPKVNFVFFFTFYYFFFGGGVGNVTLIKSSHICIAFTYSFTAAAKFGKRKWALFLLSRADGIFAFWIQLILLI